MTTTTKMGAVTLILMSLGGLFALPPVLGQDSGSVTVDVGECVELESAAERLACFEAQVDEALAEGPAPRSGDAAAAPAEIEPEERLSRQERRAQRRADAAAAETPQVPEAGEDEYFGTIAAIEERLPDSYVITLENGQIWEQTTPKRFFLRVGQEVRIYPTSWGPSYRLSLLDGDRYIQVRRVR